MILSHSSQTSDRIPVRRLYEPIKFNTREFTTQRRKIEKKVRHHSSTIGGKKFALLSDRVCEESRRSSAAQRRPHRSTAEKGARVFALFTSISPSLAVDRIHGIHSRRDRIQWIQWIQWTVCCDRLRMCGVRSRRASAPDLAADAWLRRDTRIWAGLRTGGRGPGSRLVGRDSDPPPLSPHSPPPLRAPLSSPRASISDYGRDSVYGRESRILLCVGVRMGMRWLVFFRVMGLLNMWIDH